MVASNLLQPYPEIMLLHARHVRLVGSGPREGSRQSGERLQASLRSPSRMLARAP